MMDDSPEGRTYVALLAGGPLVEVGPFHFSEDEKESLTDIVLNKLQPPADLTRAQTFIGAAERAAAKFKQLEELEQRKPAPRATHATMTNLRKQVVALRKTVEAMDSNLHRLLLVCLQHPMFHGEGSVAATSDKSPKMTREEREAAVLAMLDADAARRDLADNCISRFSQELVVLDAATEMAKAILDSPAHRPRRGRKATPWRVQYAVEVALAFQSVLEVEPTATRKTEVAKESVFESAFRICLRAVGDGITDVHEPAKDAIRRIKEGKKPEK
jgi:hypothetical protein